MGMWGGGRKGSKRGDGGGVERGGCGWVRRCRGGGTIYKNKMHESLCCVKMGKVEGVWGWGIVEGGRGGCPHEHARWLGGTAGTEGLPQRPKKKKREREGERRG